MKGVFVTGTDTDIGKTISSAIIAQAASFLTPTAYYKPVQAGNLDDSDTHTIKRLTTSDIHYQASTYQLKQPASPNRAAANEDVEIDLQKILQDVEQMDSRFHIVEGAGGCLVPINKSETIVDVAKAVDLPVVVVASTRLGTINHTLLTWKHLQLAGLNPQALVLVGEPDPGLDETLRQHIDIPYLIEIPQLAEVSAAEIVQEAQANLALTQFLKEQLIEQRPSDRDVTRRDNQYVWHPFTQHKFNRDHLEVVRGQGAYLQLANGQWLLDGISSWWVNVLGHGQPKIAEAIAQQARQLEHVIFAGFTHRPAVDLVTQLIQACQRRGCNLQRGFFSDNGSTSVEVALKMAFQYHYNRGDQKRKKFLALEGSYHGDTLGAMSVGGRGHFFKAFEPLMFDVDYIDPFDQQALMKAMEQSGELYAAIIVEPLIQGAGGMRMYPPEFLNKMASLCQQNGVLTIADEVFSGFYRTGKLFAFEHSDWRPDLLCLSKGLTGGFLPMSLTLASDDIFKAFEDDSLQNAFLHGHSYTANPVACRAALASLNLLLSGETQNQVEELTRVTKECITEFAEKPWCRNPRSLGVIGAFEVADQADYFASDFAFEMSQRARALGLLMRPLGTTVYLCPPYCVKPDELRGAYQMIEEILEHWEVQ